MPEKESLNTRLEELSKEASFVDHQECAARLAGIAKVYFEEFRKKGFSRRESIDLMSISLCEFVDGDITFYEDN